MPAWRSNDTTLIINGHPDPRPERYCAALCNAYADGMQASGRVVRQIDSGRLSLPGAVTQSERMQGIFTHELDSAIELIGWAKHLTIVYPLWLDRAPLPLQHLLLAANKGRRTPLGGSNIHFDANRTVRSIVTMDMPAFAHRRANGPKVRREYANLPLSNVSAKTPIFIGCVNTISDGLRKRWLTEIYLLGVAGG